MLVIREVDQLARRAKWRASDLAEALGVSLSMLNRLRAGTHAPSREVLGAILQSFGEHARVRELVLHFLEHELPLARSGRLDAAPTAARAMFDELRELPPAAQRELRAFVAQFLRRSLTTGRGLSVVADAALLREVAVYVRTALDAQGVASVVLAGNARISASHREAALAAPLLVVERVDFVSPAVRALLDARAAVRKPVVVTAVAATQVPGDLSGSPFLPRLSMPQRDRVTLRILQQRGTPPDAMTTVRVDLGEFFDHVRRIGRDPALLLLTIRALRQRGGGWLQLSDLAWMLGARPARLRTWLDQLARAGTLVYDGTNGSIDVELPEPDVLTWTDVHPPLLPVRHELPTYWFLHVLPRVGRTGFVVYLYLLHRDGTSAPATLTLPALAHDAALRTTLQARWHLRRLRRFGLVTADAEHDALVVSNPPPLTPNARRWLRRRRRGDVSQRWALAAVGVVTVLLVLMLLVARTAARP
ncbi:MAG TPA: helix-turn-helix domain-containing protein [Thermoanaerobaculia bacterium]